MRLFSSILFLIVFFMLFLLSGCLTAKSPTQLVTASSLGKRDDIPKIQLEDKRYPLHVSREKDGALHTRIEQKTFVGKDTFRVKCSLPFKAINMIDCTFNGKKYPLYLDTGSQIGFVVNDIHVLENRLPVYLGPVGFWKSHHDEEGRELEQGFTYVSELKFGEARLNNWLCLYRGMHAVYGKYQYNEVTAGVAFLTRFKYILFDHEKSEIEFSWTRDFAPPQGESWTKYPLSITDDARIFVRIPIAGREEKMFLDTGMDYLFLPAAKWQAIRQRLNQADRAGSMIDKLDSFPGHGKRLKSRQCVIGGIQIGNNVVPEVAVNVYPDDSELFSDFKKKEEAGIIGIECFKGTQVVLDFKGRSLWVKKAK